MLINIFFQNEQEKLWIANKVEESRRVLLSREEKKHFARLLMKAKVNGLVFFLKIACTLGRVYFVDICV